MPDYQAMYLHLMRETEKSIRILAEAQRACEEMYLSDSGPTLRVLPKPRRETPESEEE